jgi:hypothetical protein
LPSGVGCDRDVQACPSKWRQSGSKRVRERRISDWSQLIGEPVCFGTAMSALGRYTEFEAGRPRFSIRECVGRSRSVRWIRVLRQRRRQTCLQKFSSTVGLRLANGRRAIGQAWLLHRMGSICASRSITGGCVWWSASTGRHPMPSRSCHAVLSTTAWVATSRWAPSTRRRLRSAH